MLKVDGRRVTDPQSISPTEIAQKCEELGELVVQFSRPQAYTPAILESLNEACRITRNGLQVRFFGHYGSAFDAACLRHLPEARDLAVDCLFHIAHEDELGRLPNLNRLSFGVFELDRPAFLNTLPLGQLERLILSENRKRNFDLSPLSCCASLSALFVHGHSKGINAITELTSLQKLTLGSYAKSHSLNFIEGISNLRRLTLILGGRADVDDMSNKSVEVLKIVRVRGLSTLGDLSRFPSLSVLRIEDQLQLIRLDLTGAQLERLWLLNCKNLADLVGLEAQKRIREFRAYKVALDLNALRDRDWPPSARSISLFSGSEKWNDDALARLSARGLGEKGELWPD